MKRYQKANEGIHAPEEVKENAVRPSQKRPYTRWMGAVAAVLAVAIIGGIALWPGRAGGPTALSNEHPENSIQPRTGPGADGAGRSPGESVPTYGNGSHKAFALVEAVYQLPEVEEPPMPTWSDFHSDNEDEEAFQQAENAWWEALEARSKIVNAARYKLAENRTIGGFITASTAQFLTGAGEDNRVYSPLNLYMALAMLAETAGGDSRQQILDALGADSIEALREDAAAVWQNYYQDDDMGISVMANSLWLRDDMSYSQDTLDTLAANYYASSFAGEMGSAGYDQALRDWVNEQTRGVLTEQADGLSFDPATVLGLVSTLYFKAAWSDPFNPDSNTRGVFHSPDRDVEAEYLHYGEWFHTQYYWGEHFSAIGLGFQTGSYRMWLILPDEGYTVDELVAGGEAMEFLMWDKYGVYDRETDEYVGAWPNQEFLRVNLSLPKFDVSSDLELADGLKALGITDVFDSTVSNFDPLGASTDDPLCVGKAGHAARVMIDEEGCTAASYVDLMLCGAAPPPDEIVDFTLDRPFLFAITGNSNLPLFLGVVNQPNG
ncbi:MAG: hypothetical protein K2M42_09500 [Oscillospiraceae bacterium]|nr:hypothetical protein [Oscillospiraceae bacterium]